MTSQLRVGIIGTGVIAEAGHAPAVVTTPTATVGAVVSRDQARAERFRTMFGDAQTRVYTSLHDLCNDTSIDLVIVGTPDRLHHQQAAACLRAGKHVLVEKPLTTASAEAHELIELAHDHKKVLATGFHLRSHAGHRLLANLVREGAIGEIRHLRLLWAFAQHDNSNWRAHCELGRWWSLAAVGTHCLDLARFITGDTDDLVRCTSLIDSSVWNSQHDECAIVAGKFRSGPTIEVTSTVQYGPYTRVEVFGSTGIITAAQTLGRDGGGEITLNNAVVPFEPVNPFVVQLQNVMAAIGGTSPLHADGTVGLRAVRDLELLDPHMP